MKTIFLWMSIFIVIFITMYFLLKPVYRFVKNLKSVKNNLPIAATITLFCAIAYISSYYNFFNQRFVIEFLKTMEKLLHIMLILIAIIIFLYMLIGFFGKRYTLRVDNFNIGGINILFDQSNEVFVKTVGTFIISKRTLFDFDKVRDNIDQVFDAYHESYKFIRSNIELLDPQKDKELYQISIDIMKVLNIFLTKHQNDYRRWYGKISADDKIKTADGTTVIVHSTTIEEVQKHYYRYEELVSDIHDLNSFMKEECISEVFKINRFDWEG